MTEATDYVYVATRMLTLNGVEYKPGDPVDVSAVGFRRVHQLYESRKIAPVGLVTKVDKLRMAKRRPKPAEPAEAPTPVEEPAAAPVVEAQATEAPQPGPRARRRAAVHKGFGRYDVLEGDEVVAKGVPRADLPSLGVEPAE